MPFTKRQEKWLEDRENERAKFSTEYAVKLVENEAAKQSKQKEQKVVMVKRAAVLMQIKIKIKRKLLLLPMIK